MSGEGRLNARRVRSLQQHDVYGVCRRAAADHGAHGEPINPAMMDLREVATRLSVSIRTVERLIASGELRAVRVRRSVRVTPEGLDAYISGLPCQSANAQIASKSVSASAAARAVRGLSVGHKPRVRRGSRISTGKQVSNVSS